MTHGEIPQKNFFFFSRIFPKAFTWTWRLQSASAEKGCLQFPMQTFCLWVFVWNRGAFSPFLKFERRRRRRLRYKKERGGEETLLKSFFPQSVCPCAHTGANAPQFPGPEKRKKYSFFSCTLLSYQGKLIIGLYSDKPNSADVIFQHLEWRGKKGLVIKWESVSKITTLV